MWVKSWSLLLHLCFSFQFSPAPLLPAPQVLMLLRVLSLSLLIPTGSPLAHLVYFYVFNSHLGLGDPQVMPAFTFALGSTLVFLNIFGGWICLHKSTHFQNICLMFSWACWTLSAEQMEGDFYLTSNSNCLFFGGRQFLHPHSVTMSDRVYLHPLSGVLFFSLPSEHRFPKFFPLVSPDRCQSLCTGAGAAFSRSPFQGRDPTDFLSTSPCLRKN